MAVFTAEERELAEAVSGLVAVNPFLPARIELERRVLGDDYAAVGLVWSLREGEDAVNANLDRIQDLVEELLRRVVRRLMEGQSVGRDRGLYQDLVFYALYYRYYDPLSRIDECAESDGAPRRIRCFAAFARDVRTLFGAAGEEVFGGADGEIAHLFACLYQIRRAFTNIFRFIVGESLPAARLRATVWQSIFSHDMRRYRTLLFRRMSDIPVLITGPSGTGKELVARAIALSQYIPFDLTGELFAGVPGAGFFPLHLAALSPTLIESELFGHRRGAFTGALGDHVGWLEACGPHGTVFLDEIGEISSEIQVKLLRVLETRRFQRLGDTETRLFEGKLMAATNRELDHEMAQGTFRRDLFYRLCADRVTTPSLSSQLQDAPGDLDKLVRHLLRRFLGTEDIAEIADEISAWICRNLGNDYAWPGNVRELDQCVKYLLIRQDYRPSHALPADPLKQFIARFERADLTAEEVLCTYCTVAYAQSGNYVATAERLGLDRRTVKAKIDRELLARIKGQVDGSC